MSCCVLCGRLCWRVRKFTVDRCKTSRQLLRSTLNRLCPCLPRRCKVAPTVVKCPDYEYVDVGCGIKLRVHHVLPIPCTADDGHDRTDGHTNHIHTDDFWFNHWQGPHIVASSKSAPQRKKSTNRFGPADAAMSARRQSMAALVSESTAVVAPLVEDILTDALSRVLKVAPPITQLQKDGVVDAAPVFGLRGRDNPAYDSSADDEPDGVSYVRLRDATLSSTDTDPHTASRRPLLFFLHGIGGSADVWRGQVRYFSSRGYECVAPDLIGHGFSGAPSDPELYTFSSLLQQVCCLFRRYAAHRRRVVLIGHQYGSSFAAALAGCGEFSNIVLLVLVSCGGPTPLTCPGPVVSLPSCLLSCLRPLLICGFKSREMFFKPLGKSFIIPRSYDTPSYVVNRITQGQVWPEGDLSFHKQITLPTLLIYGMKDRQVSLVDMCDMEKAIPRAFLETVPQAGHMPTLEAAEETNILIDQFLTRWLHICTQ